MVGHGDPQKTLPNKTCTTHKLSYTCRHIHWHRQIWIDQFHLSDPLYKAACIPLHDETGKTHNRFLSLIIHHLISHNNSIFYNCLIEDLNISSSKTSAPEQNRTLSRTNTMNEAMAPWFPSNSYRHPLFPESNTMNVRYIIKRAYLEHIIITEEWYEPVPQPPPSPPTQQNQLNQRFRPSR